MVRHTATDARRVGQAGDLSLISGTGDIVLNGGSYTAGQVLTVAALGGCVALNAVADTEFSDSHFAAGNWIGSVEYRDQVFDLENQVVTLEGAQIDVYALGNILADGTRFRVPGATLSAADLTTGAPTGNLTLTAKYGDIYIGAPTDIHAETHLKSTSILGGLMGSTTDLRTLTTTHVASVMTVAGNIGLSAGRDLTLVAADITAGGAFSTKVDGKTHLLAAIDLDYMSLLEMSNNGIIITTETTERLVEEAFHTRIDAASVSFDASSPVTIAAYRDPFINGGHPSGWLGDGASGHMALADSLLGLTPPPDDDPTDTTAPSDWRIDLAAYGVAQELPSGAGYEYLEELAARPDTTVQPIILLDYAYYDKDTQISPAAMALLSLAVGQFVGGLNFIQGIESAVLQSAAKAGLSSVITQSVAGVVSGEFDLGEILKGAAFAGLSAGLTAGINADDLGISFGPNAGQSLLGVGQKFTVMGLVEGGLDAVISSGLSSAVYGTSFGDSLAQSLTNTVTGLLLADVQALIGKGVIGGQYSEGDLVHASLHAFAGCAAGELMGSTCQAGAAGGLLQALYAGGVNPVDVFLDQVGHANQAELIAALGGFLVSEGNGEAVSTAGTVGRSGFENNAIPFIVWLIIVAGGYTTYEGGGNPIEGLQRIGQGEDLLSVLGAAGAAEVFQFSSDHFPGTTAALVAAAAAVGEQGSLIVSWLDRSTGQVVSKTWNDLPQDVRDGIVGGTKVVTFIIPAGAAAKIAKAVPEVRVVKVGVPDGVSFGRNANQDYHVWRHIEDELGMSRQRVQDAVVADLPQVADLSFGLNVRFVTVDGVRLQYNAFRLPDGTVNIGRIHEAN